jgi:KaiC/GvpD/RAD55 family RecA-like ATPase
MDNKNYYKISYSNSIVLFFHDLEKDTLDGMVEESRSENSLKICKYNPSSCYVNVKNNVMANSMIKKAKKITKEEYETAVLVVDSMIGISDLWLIADNDFEEKEVVKTETIYV